ncbi:MAG: 23S rRNA (guanosine(2251)-2'-O)-methyltransferase RlmB [Oscillospiraceae bacterium]|nr:23S rRNA (guanosine(2251)-2'-O)-methyltransferase RlmB [Oscillospiraceae bacterium]
MSDKIEGRNPVAEAIKSGRQIDKIYVRRGDKQGSIIPLIREAKRRGIIVSEVDASKLNEMSETGNHQGVIAQVPPMDYAEVDDILKIAEERGEPPFIVILDRIADPHNLGSVIRTANCAGVHGVIISRHDSAPVTAVAAKASAGAVEFTPVARVNNLARTIDDLKKKGIWVTGADAAGDRSLYEADLAGPVAIVIGSEGEGISRLVAEKCDFLVKIPMRGNVNSLNASVAAALMIYEAAKKRV